MYTGGRGVWNRKAREDEARAIDILDLQRNKAFTDFSGRRWTSSWSRTGEVIASISYKVESDETGPIGLRFMYAILAHGTNEKKDYNYIIPIVSTPCNYGGERWWFICPLVVDGRACHRRCRIVYMPPGAKHFGCRECHRLTYESRQRHREAFYEGFEKPYMEAESAQKELSKARTRKKKEKIWQKLFRAQAELEGFENFLTSRKPKIIYKEK